MYMSWANSHTVLSAAPASLQRMSPGHNASVCNNSTVQVKEGVHNAHDLIGPATALLSRAPTMERGQHVIARNTAASGCINSRPTATPRALS